MHLLEIHNTFFSVIKVLLLENEVIAIEYIKYRELQVNRHLKYNLQHLQILILHLGLIHIWIYKKK